MLSSFGRRIRVVLATMLVVMSVAGSLLIPASTAAQAQTIQSQLTGVSITYGPPYQLNSEPTFTEGQLEIMMFVGSADILAMGFMSPLIDLNGARDIMLESLFGELGTSVTIDRGDYTGVSYSLDMLNFEGQEMGVFSLFMNQRSHGFAEFYIFIAPPALFGPTMQIAQGAFTVNGAPLMEGVDSTVMGNMVTANTGITGGTAVTDVTDVADQTNTSETTNTTQTSTTTSSGAEDGQAYVAELKTQQSDFMASFTAFAENFAVFGNDSATDQQKQAAAQGITDQATYWAGFNDRATQVSAPAGYEDVHEVYLSWSDDITTLGNYWLGVIRQEPGVTLDMFFGHLEVVNATDIEFQNILADAETRSTSTGTDTTQTTTGDTGNTGRTTRGSESTDATETPVDSGDAIAYVNNLSAQRAEFMDSFTVYAESMDIFLADSSTDAEKQAALQEITNQATYWSGANDRAAQVTAPAGYEDVHASYLNWSDVITTLGNNWLGFINQQNEADAFFDQIPVLQAADDDFVVELNAAKEQAASSSTGNTQAAETAEADATETEVATETTSRTSRTTRSTDTSESDDPDETAVATETTSGDKGTTRTSRTTTATETATTNTSETRGGSVGTSRTNTSGSTTSADNEWYMELNDVTITWNDDFGLSEISEEPQRNNEERGEDSISLQYNESTSVIRFTVTAFQNGQPDSTNLVLNLSNDPAGLQEIFGEGAEIVESVVDPEASAMLIQTEDNQGVYFVYVQTTCLNADCSTLAMLTLVGEGQPMIDAIKAVTDGVAVDGTPISDAMAIPDLENTILGFGS